jgi:hypothetical protein
LIVGKRFGAMQGGYLGAMVTITGAAIVGVIEPDWAVPMGVTTISGLMAFLFANIASVAQVNRSFAQLDTLMPGLTSVASGEPVDYSRALPMPQNPAPAQSVAPSGPSIVPLNADIAEQVVTTHVGDTLVITLPMADSYGWFYVPQSSTEIAYVSRVVQTNQSVSTSIDTWSVANKGSTDLTIQELAVDSNGAAMGKSPLKQVIYHITVS